ncbi:MAG: hypothetical protein NT126_08595, partial [Bacteroidetes bacterium]|nr:hypothetical protein [Bacteroidota bacterium]
MKTFTHALLRKVLMVVCAMIAPINHSFADGSWTQLNNFPDGAREGMFCFQVGSRCFAGGGKDGSTYYNTFYEYDPVSDTWIAKAPLPMSGLAYGVGFSIYGKGYAGIGQTSYGVNAVSFFEYDPDINTWTQKQSFPGTARVAAIGESCNGKGYVGTGSGLADMWEYDPGNDSWNQKSSLPAGMGRWHAASFSLFGKVYILGGTENTVNSHNRLFEFTTGTNSWVEKNEWYHCNMGISSAKILVINNEAYLIGGQTGNGCVVLSTCAGGPLTTHVIYKYDLGTDSWKEVDTYIYSRPSNEINSMAAFTTGNSIVVATGSSTDAVWKCNTDFNLGSLVFSSPFCPGNTFDIPYTASGFNNGNIFSIELSDSSGCMGPSTVIGSVSSTTSGSVSVTIPQGLLASPHYTIRIASTDPFYKSYSAGYIEIHSLSTGTISASGPLSFCNGGTVTLTAPASSSYLWSNGSSAQSIVATASGNYSVVVDGNTGCSSSPPAVTVSYLGNGITNGVEWKTPFRATDAWGRIQAIQQTTDGGYIAGGYSWLAKLNSNGSVALHTQPGTLELPPTTEIFALQQTSDGNYILAGDMGGISDLGIIKVDQQFNILWYQLYGLSNFYERAEAIKQCPDHGFIVAGFKSGVFSDNLATIDIWVIKTDSAGNMEWERTFAGSGRDEGVAVDVTPDGGYIVAGNTGSSDGIGTGNHGGYSDEIIIKLDASGNTQWTKIYGGSSYDRVSSIESLPGGGFIVGATSGSTDGDLAGFEINYMDCYWIQKLDDNGNFVWHKKYGNGELHSLRSMPDGGFVAAGETAYSTGGNDAAYGLHGNGDMWIMKTDAAGKLIWKKTLGGSNQDFGAAVCSSSDGSVVVGGFSNSNSGDFTGHVSGYYDNWIVKLKDV